MSSGFCKKDKDIDRLVKITEKIAKAVQKLRELKVIKNPKKQ